MFVLLTLCSIFSLYQHYCR